MEINRLLNNIAIMSLISTAAIIIFIVVIIFLQTEVLNSSLDRLETKIDSLLTLQQQKGKLDEMKETENVGVDVATNVTKITVGLPMFRAKYIGWLALESLCNQKNAPEWELIICEEILTEFDPWGEERLLQYIDRLNQANCQNVYYVGIPMWIPLSQKWKLMAQNANGTILIMQAADCYAQPYRLKETYTIMKNGRVDWCQSNKGYFYSINNNKIYSYDGSKNNHPCALNMAFSTDLGKLLPEDEITKSVDKWLYNSLTVIKGSPLNVRLNRSKNWRRGIDTHGLGNISKNREIGFNRNSEIWQETDILIEQIIAMEYVFKLRLLKGFVRKENEYRPWQSFR